MVRRVVLLEIETKFENVRERLILPRNLLVCIQQMPAALFAGMFGFTRKDFFDLGASRAEVETAPSVKF